ncbi:MAG TPA: cell envelope integrity protein TolA [Gammaproteobacteria bacterium]
MAKGGKFSALGWSLLVHAVIAAAFVVTVRFAVPVAPPQPSGEVIQAEAIDAEALRARERAKAEAARRAEEARQAELRRQREAAERAAAEQRRREEAARQAELRRQQEAREAAEAEARRIAEEARRKAEAERKRRAEEEARRKAEAERKRREAEAAARAEREQQMLRSLQAEADRLAAIRAGKQDAWVGLIRNKIMRMWLEPPALADDFHCELTLRQIPGGEIVDVEVNACDNEVLARSAEAAVWKASPLPPPEDPSLFEPYVTVTFAPEEME